MVTDTETTINKEENKSELAAVNDVKLNDDVDDDETDENEDISAYYKNVIIKLEGEVVQFDPERNVSSFYVPIEADSLSIIDVPALNQKKKARTRLAKEANASRATSKAKASLSQLFSDMSSTLVSFKARFINRLRKF